MIPIDHPLFRYNLEPYEEASDSDEEDECPCAMNEIEQSGRQINRDLNSHGVNLSRCRVQGNVTSCGSLELTETLISEAVAANSTFYLAIIERSVVRS